MSRLSAERAASATRQLKEHRVEVQLNSSISSATGESVELKSGERIPTRTLI